MFGNETLEGRLSVFIRLFGRLFILYAMTSAYRCVFVLGESNTYMDTGI